MNLYLIALIPHPFLREQIKSLKEEMKERFDAKHALKSPAHITLQMPFKRHVKEETHLIHTLKDFANRENAFTVNLFGFGCFTPRTIFVKVINQKPIIAVHERLIEVLMANMVFKENEITKKILPHLTIATRDLSIENFHKAWPEFEKRNFKSTFTAKSISLLKHNGKSWDIFKEFLFKI